MSTELMVKYRWEDQELTLTKNDVKSFISTSPNVTDKEIQDFMWLCEYRGLNPFIKEAYLIKYGNYPANIVVSKDVMDGRVDVDKRYDGEEVTHNYKRGMDLNDFWVRVKIFRKGCSRPVSDVTAYYPEYVGKKKDGSITSMWRNKPFTMLQKVCKAQAKRESNPKDLSGMYLSEEFDQQAKPTEKEIKDITPKEDGVVDTTITKEESDIVDKVIAKEETVVDAEFVEDEKPKEMTKEQDMYIRAILINNILTEKEKEGLKKAIAGGISGAFADEIIEKYKKVKAEREDNGKTHDYVSLIMEQKKKLYIPANMINEWAGTKKLSDLQDVPVPKLAEILDKAKKYVKTS